MPEKTKEEIEAIQKGPQPDPTVARAFTQVLLQVADGDCHEQLSQDLQRLVKTIGIRARESMKTVKGSLTLTLKIAGDHRDELDVTYDIKLDEPKKRRDRTTFWADRHGNVTERNPRQMELGGLRDVSKRADVAERPERDDADDDDRDDA